MSDSEERNIMNMKDLMNFANRNCGKSTTPVERMSEERANFLREALNAHSVDVVSEIKQAIAKITQFAEGNQDLPSLETAIDLLIEFTQQIDFAINFIQLGGLNAVSLILDTSKESTALVKICELSAVVAQNNPRVQAALKKTSIPAYILVLNLNSTDLAVRIMAFHALSCYARNNLECLTHFLDLGGVRVILKSLDYSSSPRLAVKCAFFLSSVASEDENILMTCFAKDSRLFGTIVDVVERGILSISYNLMEPLRVYLSHVESLESDLWLRVRNGVEVIFRKILVEDEFYEDQILSCKKIFGRLHKLS